MTLRDELLARGLSGAELDQAEREGPRALEALAIECLLLPAERRRTRVELERESGADDQFARRLWRAMGFPDVADDQATFTEDDAQALSTVCRLIEEGIVDADVAVQMTRLMGHAVARIADAEVALMQETLTGGLDPASVVEDPDMQEQAVASLVAAVDWLLPTTDALLAYLHRRHLADAAKRALLTPAAEERTHPVTVGFADLVGFTVLSRQLAEHELADAVNRFETVAFDVIALHAGRVVKTIGDEVMFLADDPAVAAQISLSLAEQLADDPDLQGLRVGLATGPVVRRQGDLFGPTVNLASRAVGVAYPGTVLVSEDVHDALADDERFTFRSIPTQHLKGIGRTHLYVLRRA